MDPDTSTSAYAILRKLAVGHPTLVIRYLPTLNALLSGKGRILCHNQNVSQNNFPVDFEHIFPPKNLYLEITTDCT